MNTSGVALASTSASSSSRVPRANALKVDSIRLAKSISSAFNASFASSHRCACVIASTHALSFACALTRATYASTSASIDALTEPGEPSLAPTAGASTRRRARAASAAAASLASRNARAIDASDIFARRSRVAE